MDNTILDDYTLRNFLDQLVAAGPDVVIKVNDAVVNREFDATQVTTIELRLEGWPGYYVKMSSAFGEVVAYAYSGRWTVKEPVFISGVIKPEYHPQILSLWETWYNWANPEDEEEDRGCPGCGDEMEENPECFHPNGCGYLKAEAAVTLGHLGRGSAYGSLLPSQAFLQLKAYFEREFLVLAGASLHSTDGQELKFPDYLWLADKVHHTTTLEDLVDILADHFRRDLPTNVIYEVLEAFTHVP